MRGVSWDRIDSWWLEELAGDPAYEEEIEPLLLSLLSPSPGFSISISDAARVD